MPVLLQEPSGHWNNRKKKSKKKSKNFFLWELKNQSKAGFLPPPFNFNFRKQQKLKKYLFFLTRCVIAVNLYRLLNAVSIQDVRGETGSGNIRSRVHPPRNTWLELHNFLS